MAKKIIFNDNIVQYPNRYSITDLGSGLYELALSPGTVTQDGTPLSAANLNAVADEVIFKLKDTSTSTTAYAASIDGLSAYYEGLTILFKPANTNTSAATLNINSISAINLKKVDDTGAKVALVANDLIKNKYYILTYDGTDLVVSNPSSDLAAIISDISNVENRLTTDEGSINSLKNEVIRFTVSTGSANTYLANLSDVTAYYSGLILNVVINVDNTGASTLNVTGLSAKAIKFAGNDLTAGTLKANTICQLIYDGTVFNLQPTAKQVNDLQNDLASHKADNMYQSAGGTSTAITLTIKGTLTNGYPITFIASANNNGAATTINGKPLYKPGTTTAPTLIVGKAYTVWYNSASTCFFIKASAEGDAVAGDVLAGKKFSNDNDTGLAGTLDLSNLTANNIKKGVNINGITGTLLGKYTIKTGLSGVGPTLCGLDADGNSYYYDNSNGSVPHFYKYDVNGTLIASKSITSYGFCYAANEYGYFMINSAQSTGYHYNWSGTLVKSLSGMSNLTKFIMANSKYYVYASGYNNYVFDANLTELHSMSGNMEMADLWFTTGDNQLYAINGSDTAAMKKCNTSTDSMATMNMPSHAYMLVCAQNII